MVQLWHLDLMTSSDVLRTLLLLLTLGDADLEQVYQLRWLPLILMAADAIAQVAGLVRVMPQLAARVIEPELVVCPVSSTLLRKNRNTGSKYRRKSRSPASLSPLRHAATSSSSLARTAGRYHGP